MKRKLSSVFVLTAILLCLSMLSSGCVEYCIRGVHGNGRVTKENRTITSFSEINVSGAFEVFLTQGSETSMVVEADENLLDIIITEVRGNTLYIDTKEHVRDCKTMAVYLTFIELKYLDLSGAVTIRSEGHLEFDDLGIEASGATEMVMALSAGTIEMDISGASEIEFTGKADKLFMDISGASEINAFELQTAVVDVELSGASEVEIFVTDELNIDASGASDIRYKGGPKQINQETSGASSIRKVD